MPKPGFTGCPDKSTCRGTGFRGISLKVINEYEFPPLEVLHFLLISLRLGRHFKGEFRLTKRGAELAQAPGRLFAELIPYFVFRIDHASYARFDERPFGKWDVWMNVINVETDQGTTEPGLFTEI